MTKRRDLFLHWGKASLTVAFVSQPPALTVISRVGTERGSPVSIMRVEFGSHGPVATGPKHSRRRRDLPVIAAVFLSFLIGAAGAFGHDGVNAFGVAIETTRRASTLLFAAAFAAWPLGRLGLGRGWFDAEALTSAFAIAFLVYLGSIAAPYLLSLSVMPVLTALFCVLNATCIGVLHWATRATRSSKTNVRSHAVIYALVTAYFWISFSIVAIAHLYGPHQPDGFYGFSLCLLIAGLLLRFANDVARLRDGYPTRELVASGAREHRGQGDS
jgi:hypothetical protein